MKHGCRPSLRRQQWSGCGCGGYSPFLQREIASRTVRLQVRPSDRASDRPQAAGLTDAMPDRPAPCQHDRPFQHESPVVKPGQAPFPPASSVPSLPLGRLANQVARMGPETLCQKLKTALGTATMGALAKCRILLLCKVETVKICC